MTAFINAPLEGLNGRPFYCLRSLAWNEGGSAQNIYFCCWLK